MLDDEALSVALRQLESCAPVAARDVRVAQKADATSPTDSRRGRQQRIDGGAGADRAAIEAALERDLARVPEDRSLNVQRDAWAARLWDSLGRVRSACHLTTRSRLRSSNLTGIAPAFLS